MNRQLHKIIYIALCAIFIASCSTNMPEAKTSTLDELLNPNSQRVLVISHRADWRNHLENSMPAIEGAIAMGVDIIEIDIQRTKDGELILMHDKTLDRTTTGKGKVADWTLDSIKTLNLKNGCNIKTIHRVPTLREAMLAAKGRIMVNLDKAYDIFPEVYKILEETGTVDHVILKGYKSPSEVKKDLGAYPQEVLYMPIISLDKASAMAEIEEWITSEPPIAFEFLFAEDSNRLPYKVKELLKGKSKIWYNTLWDTMAGGHDDDMALEDIDGAYGYLIDSLGTTMIQTDRPQMLIEYLKDMGRHN